MLCCFSAGDSPRLCEVYIIYTSSKFLSCSLSYHPLLCFIKLYFYFYFLCLFLSLSPFSLLPCMHSYCAGCYSEWMDHSEGNSCPAVSTETSCLLLLSADMCKRFFYVDLIRVPSHPSSVEFEWTVYERTT